MKEKPAYYRKIIHNNKRRAPWHDYHSRQIYMITINKEKGCPAFGRLVNIQHPEEARIELSPIGDIIREQILATPAHNPAIRNMTYIIMPDHIHLLLFVTERMEKRSLGDVIQALKAASTTRIRALLQSPELTVFEAAFHDRIVSRRGQLQSAYEYIQQNPYRLAIRKRHPEYFRRVNHLRISDYELQAYGNMHLLDNPFKSQVVIHRADTPEQRACNRREWLYAAANGGVLVSPFISADEKTIRMEAETLDGNIILLTADTFEDRYKPYGHNFSLCESGQLLIISAASALRHAGILSSESGSAKKLTRQQCLALNKIAALIAATKD